MRKTLVSSMILASAIATPAMAYEAGDFVIRAGVATVTTNEKT